MISQNIQIHETAFPTVAQDVVLASPAANKQLVVHSVSAYNAGERATDVGLGVRYAKQAWKLWTLASGTAQDETETIQAGQAITLFTTANDDGFLVQARDRFSLVSLTLSQAEAGSPAYVYEYWNGSSWAALTLRNEPKYDQAGSLGIAFAPPPDWMPGSGTLVDDFSLSNPGYCIRVTAGTAPSQDVRASQAAVSRLWAYRQVPGKATLLVDFIDRPVMLDAEEVVQAFFADANALNSVEVCYQVGG